MTTIKNGAPIRLRRSVLYLPGGNQRALEKARSLPADALIFDLEDAVGPARKDEARALVAAALAQGGYAPRECVVRVNGLDTHWCDRDLAMLADSRAAAILLPKVNHVDDVARIEQRLSAAGVDARVTLWVMAETAAAISNIGLICRASPRIDCVVLGTSDLARELRVPDTPGRLGLLTALSICVVAARSAGVDVLDGVHLDLKDARGFERSCEQGKNLGFDGKTLIHPDQIAAANRVFSPGEGEVERARRIVNAWGEAEARGEGVVVVDGRLVESLHAAEARRVLSLASLVAQRDS